jgi:hypothetical protein
MKTHDIHLKPEIFLLAILFLILFIGSLEILLRIPQVTARLAAPTFGSDHQQFELQLARLEAARHRHGTIDCIFIGDSLVWLDMDPIAFNKGYQERNGQAITCFNFGIAALPASGVSQIAEILAKEYNPKLLIYGLHANSVVVSENDPDTKIIVDTPWVRYKTGELDLEGWLYEHVYVFRYKKVVNRIIKFDTEAVKSELGYLPQQQMGLDAKSGQRIDVRTPPSPSDPADEMGFKKYHNYQIYPENLAGIQKIAALADSDTRVIMVMMPVYESFYAFFENGEQDYLEIASTISRTLDGANVVFLKPEGQIQLTLDDWWDYSHLNSLGAQEFSYWLGGSIGAWAFGD